MYRVFYRLFSILALTNTIFFVGSSFAQQSDQTTTSSYQQQVQNLFNQTDNQAKSQFDKNFPKPTIPQPPPPPQQGATSDKNASDNSNTSGGWQPPSKGWTPPAPTANWGATTGNTGSNSKDSQQQSTTNIYASGGASNTNSTNSAGTNPYR